MGELEGNVSVSSTLSVFTSLKKYDSNPEVFKIQLMRISFLISIITLALISSCIGKQLKTHYIYWDDENKSIVKYKMQVNYEGIVDGYCWHYYRNGQLTSKTRYEDNKLMEIYTVYDTLGNNLNYGSLTNGTGYVIFYDEKKGIKHTSGPYKNGLRNGWWKRYNFRGDIMDSLFFENGMNEGLDFYLFLLY